MERRPATSVRLLADLGDERGLDVPGLLAPAGLTPDDLMCAAVEVTADQEATVLAGLVAASGDPVGLGWCAGRRYHLTTYGIWGFALVSSPTRAAIEVGSRHLALTSALADITVTVDADRVRIRLDGGHLPAGVREAAVARDAAAIAAVRDELVASEVMPFVAVRSRSRAPTDPDLGRRTFGIAVDHGA